MGKLAFRVPASVLGVIFGSAILVHSGGAAGDPAQAQTLFEEGRKLADQGAYDKACPKFEASRQVFAGIGTRFNLADCWERLGRTASAWTEYLAVAAAAKAAGQTDRERVARDRAAALAPELSRLVVEVKAPEPSLEVLRDGTPIVKASWGVAVPTDPGPHLIEARAPNKQPWTLTLEVPKGGRTVAATVPPLANNPNAAQSPPKPPDPLAPPAAASTVSPTTMTPVAASTTAASEGASDIGKSSSMDSRKMAGLVVGGAGVVGLGVSAVLGLMTKSKDDDARKICEGLESNCPGSSIAERDSLVDSARGLRTGGYIALAAGGALLATGAVLFLTAPKRVGSVYSGHTVAAPMLGPGTVGATLSAQW